MSAMIWYQFTGADLDVTHTNDLQQKIQTFQQDLQIESTHHTISIDRLPSPANRAMAYGDGFFTTMGVYQSTLLWQRYHDARLRSHAQALYLYLPSDTIELLWQTVTDFASKINHGIIKVVTTRQAQALRGYAYSPELSDNNCDIYIGVLQTPPLATQVIAQHSILQQPPITAVCLHSQLACLPKPLVGLKTLNRLDSVLVAGELEAYKRQIGSLQAESQQIGEGLVRDITGQWVEGVMSNVFYQLGGATDDNTQWYTPPLESSGVRGVMRQVIVDKFADSETPISLRALQDEDLGNIKALFFCNAVRGIIPVDKLILPSGQVLALSLGFTKNSVEI